jgi:hypothetical protein
MRASRSGRGQNRIAGRRGGSSSPPLGRGPARGGQPGSPGLDSRTSSETSTWSSTSPPRRQRSKTSKPVSQPVKSMVVGTTGWYDQLPRIRERVERSRIGFLYGANFSVGVNVFYDVVEAASEAIAAGIPARFSSATTPIRRMRLRELRSYCRTSSAVARARNWPFPPCVRASLWERTRSSSSPCTTLSASAMSRSPVGDSPMGRFERRNGLGGGLFQLPGHLAGAGVRSRKYRCLSKASRFAVS